PVAARLYERLPEDALLVLLHRKRRRGARVRRAACRRPRSGRPAEPRIEVELGQLAALAEHDRVLAEVAELADVPGPGIGLERLHRPRLDLDRGDAVLLRERLYEMREELRDVLPPLAQGRHHEAHDVQPEEQVLAELAL